MHEIENKVKQNVFSLSSGHETLRWIIYFNVQPVPWVSMDLLPWFVLLNEISKKTVLLTMDFYPLDIRIFLFLYVYMWLDDLLCSFFLTTKLGGESMGHNRYIHCMESSCVKSKDPLKPEKFQISFPETWRTGRVCLWRFNWRFSLQILIYYEAYKKAKHE